LPHSSCICVSAVVVGIVVVVYTIVLALFVTVIVAGGGIATVRSQQSSSFLCCWSSSSSLPSFLSLSIRVSHGRFGIVFGTSAHTCTIHQLSTLSVAVITDASDETFVQAM
jgi:hypothetical protein